MSDLAIKSCLNVKDSKYLYAFRALKDTACRPHYDIEYTEYSIQILHCTKGVVSHFSSKRRALEHSAGEYRGSDEEEFLKASGM